MMQLAKLLPTDEGVDGLREWVDSFRAGLFEHQSIEVTGFGYFTLDRDTIEFKAKVPFYEEIKTKKRSHPKRDGVVGTIARAFREGYDAVTLDGIGTFVAVERPTGDGIFVKLAVDDSFRGKTIADLEEMMLSDDADAQSIAYAAPKLRALGSTTTVERLVAMLCGKGQPNVRARAALALGYLAPLSKPAVPELIGAARDKSSDVRGDVFFALGELGPHAGKAVDVLARGLDDADSLCRRRAAFSLGQIGEAAKPAVAALVACFEREPDPMSREVIIQSLGEIKDPKATPTIISAIQDQDEDVQTAALRALRGWKASGPAKKFLQELVAKNEAEIKKVISGFGGRSKLDQFGAELVELLQEQNRLARKLLPKT